MGIITWIILGLAAGALARAIHPGPDSMGIIATMLVGVVGAFIGGLIGRAVLGHGVTGFNLVSILLAAGGAVLLLFIYHALRPKARIPH